MRFSLSALLLLTMMLVACKTSTSEKTIMPVSQSGQSLREIAKQKFPDSTFIVGVTCGLWAFDYPAGAIVDTEFGYVTPENDFKQKTIHPDNTKWDFTGADKWISHAATNNQIVRIHSPIGPQVSVWTQEDSRTKEDLEKNMTDFLTAVCDRYNGNASVKYMDVVNETVDNGAWFGPKPGANKDLWENPWTIIGSDNDKNATPLYIKKAFTIASAHAPKIKLLYNHHEGPENTASWNLIKETILYLRASGLRVDAIGWQSHVDNGWATEAHVTALKDLIAWAQGNSLEFHITEASSFIQKSIVTQADLDLQATTYAAIFKVVMDASKKGTTGWNTWHLTDAYTYRSECSPALFDKDNNAKPAYYAIKKCLEDY